MSVMPVPVKSRREFPSGFLLESNNSNPTISSPDKQMYWTYILQSQTTGQYYIGYTADLADRLRRNNQGLTRTTRRRKEPFFTAMMHPNINLKLIVLFRYVIFEIKFGYE
jgi:GIY-YIG catalytic domain